MPNPTAVRFSEDDLDIGEMTTVVQQGEQYVGPLLAISPCEDFPPKRLTCFTHEHTATPAKPLELRLCPGGVPPAVPGKDLVCIGDCFIRGKLLTVGAFR